MIIPVQVFEMQLFYILDLLYDQTNFGPVKHNCWLLGHRVSHAKRATARTHDACVFTKRQ